MSLDRYVRDDDLEAHERRITRCKSCRARIVWLITVNGRNMPTDADTVEAHDTEFEYGRHVSHFSTCANADQHRKKPR